MPAKAKVQAKGKLHQVFCEQLKARRIELGLTQQAVADALGVTQPTYCAMENGEAAPTLTQIERVAKVLKIEASRLLERERAAVA